MPDTLSPEQRSRCMAAVRGKDTTPELMVRRLLHAMGFRFRLHVAGLAGRPDIVLARHRAVVFVHGCFWHRHRCRAGRAAPRTRAKFWRAKFAANRARDRRNIRALRRAGWRVVVVWECQTKDAGRLESMLRANLGARGGGVARIPSI